MHKKSNIIFIGIEVVEDYLLNRHQRKNHSKETLRTERGILRLYIGIPVSLWEKHFYKRQGRISPHTAQRELTRLKTFLNWCKKNKIIKKNPLDEVEKPKVPTKLPRALTYQQEAMLVQAVREIGGRDEVIINTFLLTGLRRKELIELRYENVDFDRKQMCIFGKGGKDRIVPICDNLVVLLKKWREEHENSEKFFNISVSTLRRMHAKIKTKSKVDFYFHQLRHTFATRFLESNPQCIYALKEIMGHSDIKTTQEYLHLSANYHEYINNMPGSNFI